MPEKKKKLFLPGNYVSELLQVTAIFEVCQIIRVQL